MKNFDLKKYLAENKLLNEQSKYHSLTDKLKIHFQTAYEKGLEAQPEDDYDSFDKKYWKNNALEIDNTIRRQQQDSDDDLRDSYSQYGSFKEEVNESFYNKPNTFKDGFNRSIEQLNNVLNSNVREYMLDEKEAIQLYSKEIKTIISKLEEISNNI